MTKLFKSKPVLILTLLALGAIIGVGSAQWFTTDDIIVQTITTYPIHSICIEKMNEGWKGVVTGVDRDGVIKEVYIAHGSTPVSTFSEAMAWVSVAEIP